MASGTIVDIRTTNSLVAGVVDGSFREFVLWTIDENPVTNSTLNLRAEPFAERLSANGDPSLLFSSYTHGDPFTPLPRAYVGDPLVIRTINVGPTVDSLHVDGHRFLLEARYIENGEQVATPEDTLHYGISERFTLILQSGQESRMRVPGDYLYMNAIGRRFREGAWGIVRVLGGRVPDLQPLPGNEPPTGGSLPAPTGGRPPEPADPGNPCPANAPVRSFAISAVDVPTTNSGPGNNNAVRAVFVPSADASLARSGTLQPEPLVLHAAAGECVVVRLTNERQVRVSFHLGELVRTRASSGANVGFDPEQTVAPGTSRTYRLYADSEKIESALISDFGDPESGQIGLYGALVVAPAGATFTDPGNGRAKDVGAQVDVHVPSRPGYRDFTAILTDRDPRIGQSSMPYPTQVEGPVLINYRKVRPQADDAGAFTSQEDDEPATPIVRAQAGDPLRVHALVAPTSEQTHVFSLGGLSWPIDPRIPDAEELESRALGPWQAVDAAVVGGAGGRARFVGDLFYGDLRRPFTLAGMWGLQRVLPRDPGGGLAWGPGLDSTRPMVEITATGTFLSGVVPLSASESDNVGVTEVLFRLDGLPLGTADTTAPFALSWDTKTAVDGPHTLSAVARDAAGNATGSMPVVVMVDNTAPTVALDDPGAFLRSTVNLTASAADVNGVASVAFQRAAAGMSTWTTIATDETAPFAASFDTTALLDGLYDLRAVATDRAGNQAFSAVLTGRRIDNTAPVVSLTAPLAGITVSGIVTVAASALDEVGVVGVQFQLDGAALGSEDIAAPYEILWDTKLSLNVLHTLTVVARDAAGNTATSVPVSVTVSNLLPSGLDSP